MGPSRPTQLFSHDENVAVPSLLTHVVKAFPSCGTLHNSEVDVGVVGSVHAPAPPPKLASTPHQQPKQQTAAAARKMPLVPVNHFQQCYSHYLSICNRLSCFLPH